MNIHKVMRKHNSFHGDLFLIDFVVELAKETDYFIETGTYAGNTLKGFSSSFPQIPCHSCEIDEKHFLATKKNVLGQANANVYKQKSPEFLYQITKEKGKDRLLFWIDAHGYGYEWPLKSEVEFITSNFKRFYMLIDDFKVPGIKEFGFDKYKGQECSYEFIRDNIKGKVNIYYPAYKERTSKLHPLRGWVLITRGLTVPENDHIRLEK